MCELDAAGNAVAGVVFGANGLLVYGTAGYQFDPQGNATHLLNSSGSALGHLAYDAWGQLIFGSNPTPYGYKAQGDYYTDAETGLLLLDRYLDPTTGRFLTRVADFEYNLNLYVYVDNRIVAPPRIQPGDEVGGNGDRPPPRVRLPRLPPFLIRCICVAGLLLCAKPTAPPESDELYPGPEPPCSDYEKQGFNWADPMQAARQCAEPGDSFKYERPRHSTAKDYCPGKGEHTTWKVSKSHHISVVCCPCATAKGGMTRRCKCWRKPNKW